MDGSQKIPQRWLSTLSVHQEAGRETPAILQALASWVLYVRGTAGAVDDPMRDQLTRAWQSAGHAGIAGALFGANGLFREHWIASEAMLEQLDKHIRRQLT